MKFQNLNKAPLFERIIAALIFKISIFKFISSRLRYAGEIADFSWFQKIYFGRIKFNIKREHIWRDIELKLGNEVTFVELGVASGYLTGWWLSPLRKSLTTRKFEYHGFDSFQGLPNRWRNFDKGAFTTNGVTPDINNSDLTFHVGLIENTLNHNLAKQVFTGNQLVIFFDLDLFDPSFHGYSIIRPYLKKGDILYFDEARDADERKLLEMHVMKDFLLTPISTSYSNVAFSIASISI